MATSPSEADSPQPSQRSITPPRDGDRTGSAPTRRHQALVPLRRAALRSCWTPSRAP